MKILSYAFLKTVTLGEFTAMEVWGLSVLKKVTCWESSCRPNRTERTGNPRTRDGRLGVEGDEWVG